MSAAEPDAAMNDKLCTHCGANWSLGQFTEDCPQCGGGAMDIPCLLCGGACGERWQRAVMDSQDADVAHWYGHCRAKSAEAERE
jgi:hypothetical protein